MTYFIDICGCLTIPIAPKNPRLHPVVFFSPDCSKSISENFWRLLLTVTMSISQPFKLKYNVLNHKSGNLNSRVSLKQLRNSPILRYNYIKITYLNLTLLNQFKHLLIIPKVSSDFSMYWWSKPFKVNKHPLHINFCSNCACWGGWTFSSSATSFQSGGCESKPVNVDVNSFYWTKILHIHK